jgi:DNA mismatch repair protein MutS
VTTENLHHSTPLMTQYYGIKNKYPNAVLLFRVGDFYETFAEDAVEVAKILNITLTKRANGSASHVQLAGFPYHSLDTYLPKLVAAGKRVAVCEQLEEPQKGKKIVRRGVTELVTPGLVTNEQMLNKSENNFLLAIHIEKEVYGIALLDISTGSFFLTEGNQNYFENILQFYKPKEILYQKNLKKPIDNAQWNLYPMQDWSFGYAYAFGKLTQHFETTSVKGFGVEEYKIGIVAAGVILTYLDETHHQNLAHITSIRPLEKDTVVWMDRFTVNNLELIHSTNENASTVFDIINQTISSMGARLLKNWLLFPLKNIQHINNRQLFVECLYNEEDKRKLVQTELSTIPDLERVLARIVNYKATPKQIKSVCEGLKSINKIKTTLQHSDAKPIKDKVLQINECKELIQLIEDTLQDDPPHQLIKGNVIKPGFSGDLDQLRELLYNGKDYLEQYRIREVEKTGISSLRITHNGVFGYYIEVRNTHKDKVPEEWVRKQTLVNAERYITEELKNFETQILGAEEKLQTLEKQLFLSLLDTILDSIEPIQKNAKIIAEIDCFQSLASVAIEKKYTKPEINNSLDLFIEDGRHPVIENCLPMGETYVSNSVFLSPSEQQIIMVTGPNMAGKSALLRQTAIIVILAQMGGFIPAKSAKIGFFDKIFTRVGASDNISKGESTFMVEMNETASILNNLSDRSLILLDEIGRGTSTYDGVSIAWAIAVYLHEHFSRPKTLFATHYHELNEMTSKYKRIKNFNVSVKEIEGKILFMRKLVEGAVAHSFGIYVAKMAGIPKEVISSAEKILKKLEKNHVTNDKNTNKWNDDSIQLSLFQLDDPLLESIKEDILNLDINTLTPVEALFTLNQIKRKLGGS